MRTKGNLRKRIWQNKTGYLLMAPFLLIFFTFTVWPVVFSMAMSLTNYNAFNFPKFVGIDNYIKLFFRDDIFKIALQNTFQFALIVGPVSYILCLFFAWVINELQGPIRPIMTFVLYAPSIAGNVYVIWKVFFDGDIYGYLNSFLLKMGLEQSPQQWLSNPVYMMTIVIIVQLWMSLGTSFLTLRAGFTTIDKQYYEAAALDGMKNRWQELWFVTLPMITPHLMLSAILAITAAFGSAGVATELTGFPSTNYATHMLAHHLQDYNSIRMERGYAASIAMVIFFLSFGVNQLAQVILRRVGK